MKVKQIFALAVGILLSVSVLAEDDYTQVRERLAGMLSGDRELLIAETPIDGMLQIRIGSEIIYMTDDGRFLVQGRVLDLENQTDLTDQARSDVRREALAAIDSDEWISYGPEDAEFQVLVFTDPDCGYCRRLHQQMAEYNAAGIRINYMGFPRAGIGSETHAKLERIWCAEDQQGAMDTAKGGGNPAPAECENPVARHYELGQTMGVTGTPALMTLDGDLIPGYVPPDQLRERLERLLSTDGNTASR